MGFTENSFIMLNHNQMDTNHISKLVKEKIIKSGIHNKSSFEDRYKSFFGLCGSHPTHINETDKELYDLIRNKYQLDYIPSSIMGDIPHLDFFRNSVKIQKEIKRYILPNKKPRKKEHGFVERYRGRDMEDLPIFSCYRIKKSDLVLCPFNQYVAFDKLSRGQMVKVVDHPLVKDLNEPLAHCAAVLTVAENVQFGGTSSVDPVIMIPQSSIYRHKIYDHPNKIPHEFTSVNSTCKGFVAIYLDL